MVAPPLANYPQIIMLRFAKPKTDMEVMQAQESAEPNTTARNTKWAVNLWKEWSEFRESSNVESPGRPPHLLSFEQLNYWTDE